jgi:phospholipase C
VVSPWSRGGWVCSEVFDHTSLIRFIERRFGRRNRDLIESNITPWRRAVCGDLTSAFNFDNPNAAPVELPDTAAYLPPNHDRYPDYVPTPPTQQSLPKQERGVRRARALPYELRVDGTANAGNGSFRIDFKNTGKAGVCFQVRSGNPSEGPWTYTVEADKSLANSWPLASAQGKYDLSVFGPNGFLRQFRGTVARNAAVDLDVDVRYDVDDCALVLRITNQARVPAKVRISSAYDGKSFVDVLPRGRGTEKRWPLKSTFGWYDLTVKADGDAGFLRRVAGHLENGRDSVSDPALGG